MENLSDKLRIHWHNCNQATTEFAKAVPADRWSEKAFDPRFKSFSWEFSCLVRTRLCYLKAFQTGYLEFRHQEDIPDKDVVMSWDKNYILEKLEVTSIGIFKEIEVLDTPEKVDMATWLLEHERIHQGKLILYFAKTELLIPEEFKKTWGQENFPDRR
ncbi:hypothetical protein JXA34_02155 [Patescibacteria group bacterium]|nr:hypothetical protein [Patescibacteria group bacterium]